MKQLYNLTEQQMKDVYEEYLNSLYEDDINAVFENLDNADDINLSDEEMASAVASMKNDLECSVCYSDFARSALAWVLEERNEKLKEEINRNKKVISQINS